jgi:hypothetical protein
MARSDPLVDLLKVLRHLPTKYWTLGVFELIQLLYFAKQVFSEIYILKQVVTESYLFLLVT